MLKPLDEITAPDPIHGHFGSPSDFGPVTLEDHYRDLEILALKGSAPPDVVTVWDRGRNIFLYSWYSYELASAAQPQAFMALELALRLRLQERAVDAHGLQGLIERAVKDDLLTDHFKRPVTLADTVAKLRNHWSHGSANLADPNFTIGIFQRCKGLIEELFP